MDGPGNDEWIKIYSIGEKNSSDNITAKINQGNGIAQLRRFRQATAFQEFKTRIFFTAPPNIYCLLS